MLWDIYRNEIDSTVRAHWRNYNKMRLDFADGTLPESNPVNFYFYCDMVPADDDAMTLKVGFKPAHDVNLAEAQFYDGLVYCDQSGQVQVAWERDKAEDSALSAMADELESYASSLMRKRQTAAYDQDSMQMEEIA